MKPKTEGMTKEQAIKMVDLVHGVFSPFFHGKTSFKFGDFMEAVEILKMNAVDTNGNEQRVERYAKRILELEDKIKLLTTPKKL